MSDPLDVLQDFMAALGRRDKAAMRAVLVPEGSATHSRDGRVTQARLVDIPERLPPGDAVLEERIVDPVVHVDDDVAVVWAPYEFYVDGVLHHKGTNAVTFIRIAGKWLITGVTDNGRTPQP